MDDMISRQAAIEYFVINVGWHDEDGYPVEDSDELRKIWTDLFNGLPSARRKGKWITKMVDCSNILLPFCSVCNKPLMFHDHNLRPNFCPNCGARMVSE